MFTVSVESHFIASHQLTLPDGSEEPLHQHNWSVTADVSSETVGTKGFVIDFNKLKAIVDNIVSELSNVPLEKIDYFKNNNSSAETIAKYIYEQLVPKLPKTAVLESISVAETPERSAKFSK